jgi:hypothetical protein
VIKYLLILTVLLTGTAWAIQRVPDKQILITTNSLTTITGVTNLNDLVSWIDTRFSSGITTNIDYSTFTGNVWFTDGLLTNSVP